VVRCHVPRVIGMTLKKAKALIRNTNCSVGRIRRTRSRRVGRVLSQSPRPGAVRSRGTKVTLLVGRR
jgi:beta-lactam-binding protein with PASTA domain